MTIKQGLQQLTCVSRKPGTGGGVGNPRGLTEHVASQGPARVGAHLAGAVPGVDPHCPRWQVGPTHFLCDILMRFAPSEPSYALCACPHGRQRSQCKDYCGKGLCEHGRQRSKCEDGCGGSGIYEHRWQRNKCKDCGGGNTQSASKGGSAAGARSAATAATVSTAGSAPGARSASAAASPSASTGGGAPSARSAAAAAYDTHMRARATARPLQGRWRVVL